MIAAHASRGLQGGFAGDVGCSCSLSPIFGDFGSCLGRCSHDEALTQLQGSAGGSTHDVVGVALDGGVGSLSNRFVIRARALSEQLASFVFFLVASSESTRQMTECI